MRFRAKFNGRKLNAIGVMYDIKAICEGDNLEQAKFDLYNRYEHITKLRLKPIVVLGESDGNTTSES